MAYKPRRKRKTLRAAPSAQTPRVIVNSYRELTERRKRILEDEVDLVKRFEFAHRALTDAMRAHRELVQRRAEFQFEEQETDHLKQLVQLSAGKRMNVAGDDD